MLDVESRYPGLQGLGFAADVPDARLKAFLARAQIASTPQFTLIPAGDRERYVPITYYQAIKDRKSTRLNSSHKCAFRMTSSAKTKKSEEPRIQHNEQA